MLFFVFFLFLFFGFLNFCVMDYFVWWRVFVVCTFVFVFLSGSFCSRGGVVSYYLVQEVCGYYFLVFDSWKVQFFFLMLKSGSAPFHFWIFRVLGRLDKWFVLWFLTLQKLPYFVVLVIFCSDFFFYFVFFGLIFCYFQVFLFRNFMDVLVVSSTESFNWLLLLGVFSFNEIFVFFFFYYFVVFLVLSYFFVSGYFGFFSVEMLLLLFNVPLRVTFFLKILLFFSSGGVYVGFCYLFLLFFLLLMSVSLVYFFFFFSMLFCVYGLKFYDYFFYVFFCVGFLSFF